MHRFERLGGLVGGIGLLVTVCAVALQTSNRDFSVLALAVMAAFGVVLTLGGLSVRFRWAWRVFGVMLIGLAVVMVTADPPQPASSSPADAPPSESPFGAWFIAVLMTLLGLKLILRRTPLARRFDGLHVGFFRGTMVDVCCIHCRTPFAAIRGDEDGDVPPCRRCFTPRFEKSADPPLPASPSSP
jgi:hypothetical protein